MDLRTLHARHHAILKLACALVEKWDIDRIHVEQDGFAVTTRRLTGALAHRVDREERELYPLAEGVAKRAARGFHDRIENPVDEAVIGLAFAFACGQTGHR